MNLPRRKFLHLATGAAVLPAVTSIGWALDYPTRPVRIIAGFPPGGGVDINARHLGTEAVVRASPDGYTLLLATAANAVNATLYESLISTSSARQPRWAVSAVCLISWRSIRRFLLTLFRRSSPMPRPNRAG